MKKGLIFILCVFFLAAAVSTASARTVRQDCGCGLGGMALGNQTGFGFKILATFLNNISANQTFGISSGTLDCDPRSSIFSKMDSYIADNMDILAVEIAQGEGESLDALAEIADISADKKATFCASLQNNFAKIFPNETVTHDAVSKEILAVIETI